jgi:hypothetical protein
MESCNTLPCIWDWVGTHASTLIALCAMIIALAAAIYLRSQAAAGRKHDRLSVMPMLDIPFNYTIEAVHPERPQLHCHMTLSLCNSGLGTAIIKKYEVYVDGNLIPTTPRDALEIAILASLGLSKLQMSKISYFAYQRDHSLPKDQAVQIIDLAFIAPNQVAWEEILQRFSQSIGARIGYVSLYGDAGTCEKGVVPRP